MDICVLQKLIKFNNQFCLVMNFPQEFFIWVKWGLLAQSRHHSCYDSSRRARCKTLWHSG